MSSVWRIQMTLRASCLTVLISASLFSCTALACNTGDEGCAGNRTFKNTNPVKSCYRIFSDTHTRGFCLDPGDSSTEYIRTGDRYCMIAKDEAPPNDCQGEFMNTDS